MFTAEPRRSWEYLRNLPKALNLILLPGLAELRLPGCEGLFTHR